MPVTIASSLYLKIVFVTNSVCLRTENGLVLSRLMAASVCTIFTKFTATSLLSLLLHLCMVLGLDLEFISNDEFVLYSMSVRVRTDIL